MYLNFKFLQLVFPSTLHGSVLRMYTKYIIFFKKKSLPDEPCDWVLFPLAFA
jgi:hypothetical protein